MGEFSKILKGLAPSSLSEFKGCWHRDCSCEYPFKFCSLYFVVVLRSEIPS